MGKVIVKHAAVMTALKGSTVVIIARTTNGYAAQELLISIGQT